MMKNIIDRFQGGGCKTIGYALVAMFALCVAQSVLAHSTWICPSGSGASWGTASNWSGTGGSLLFTNATTSVRDLSFLNADYTGKFKIGSDTTARYRGLYYGGRNANAPWKLNGQGKYKYDCSGATDNTGKIVIGYYADTYLCAYAISLKAYNVQIGHDTAGTYSGTLSIYDTSNGSPSLESLNDMLFYKGALYATNTALTCGRNMDVYDFHVNKKGGDWSVTGRLYIGVPNSTFCHDGGSMTVGGQFRVSSQSGSSGEFTMNGGNVTANDNLYVGCNADVVKGVFNMNGGNFTCNGTTYVPFAKNVNPAELHINGGTFTAAGPFIAGGGTDSASTGIIDLNGNDTSHGVLETKGLTLGSGTATLTFNGGELKAIGTLESSGLIKSGITVRVGERGGIVNANEKSVSIPVALGAVGDTGAMTFKGGGVIALSGVANYTGGTTNVADTILSLTTAAKSSIVANSVAVEIPVAGVVDGTVIFEVTDGGTFTQTEVDAMVVTGTDASRYVLVLADNATKVAISDTHKGEYVWNGGNSEDSWRTSGNWSKNGTPGDWYDSTAAFFRNAGDAATVDSAVTAASVTFGANATVGGAASLTAPLIVVSNGVSATIAAPTAGTLEKKGPGTLTLSSSRTAQTDIAEGTLVMSGAGTTLDWSDVTLGTVAGKTAILKYEDGATFASNPASINLGHDAAGSVGGGVTAELHKSSGDWNLSGRIWIGWNAGDVGRFYHNGGTTTVGGQFRVSSQTGSEGEFTMNGGTVTVNDNLYVGCNVNVVKGVFNMNGGNFICNGTAYVPYSKNVNPAELHINGGVFTAAGTFIAGYGANSEAVIEINSTDGTPGVLETKGLTLGSGTATLTFNGGELKATGSLESSGLIADGITVRVAANGGTINANSNAVSMPATLGVAGDTGGMTFKGSGTITLSAAPSYSGTTTVEVGTTLVVPTAIAGANLEFMIPAGLTTGIYKVMEVSGGGAFAADVLSSVTLPTDVNAHFFLDNGDTEIWCAYSTEAGNIWIGGASGSLNDPANWNSGSVPTSGTAIIGNNTTATLTNPDGSAFAALRIVVPSSSAAVTISGAAFSGITQIVNYSTSEIEFQNAVTFVNNVNVTQNTGTVKFTGGATGVQLSAATDIHGTYNFTKTGDLVEIANTVVKSDGVYKLPDGTFFKHNADFNVEAGGEVEVKNAKIKHSNNGKKLFGVFYGVFKVDGEFSVSGDSASSYVTHYVCDSGTGTLVANKIHVLSRGTIVPTGMTIMGPGGIFRESTGYVRVNDAGSHTFGAYADWTMYHDSKGSNTGTGGFAFYKHDSTTQTSLTFDTTDYYDNTIGRTITCEAPIGAVNDNSAAAFKVTVKGKGRFVFANTDSGATLFSGGLTVTNSATVEVKANARPGAGAVTLCAGTTLVLTSTGDEFTPLANALGLPSEGTATLRIDGAKLKIGDHTINSGVAATAADHLAVGQNSEALVGRRASLAVKDGNLVLSVRQKGVTFILK